MVAQRKQAPRFLLSLVEQPHGKVVGEAVLKKQAPQILLSLVEQFPGKVSYNAEWERKELPLQRETFGGGLHGLLVMAMMVETVTECHLPS